MTEKERQGLEADILKHGCLTPIVTWNNIIVDGHIRYAICEKYGLPFETVKLEFDTLDDAMFWAWTHQDNRRNLTPYQRTEIALQFKSMIVAKAKNNMAMGGKQIRQNESTSINTGKELGQIAGVSHDTVHKVEYLDKHADEDTKQRLRNGQTSINREYTRLKEATAPMLQQPVSVPLRKVTSVQVSPKNAQELIETIADRFGVAELERFIFKLVDQLQEVSNQASFNAFVKKLVAKYCQQ